jgi:diacylglycerol kinase family enzyme
MPLPAGSRLLALVNTAAGNGTAQQLIDDAVSEVFGPAGIVVEQLATTHLGHARDYVEAMPADELYSLAGLIIVSGDGLIAEVIQGLSRRSDADKALQMPLGPYPAGSGNGLCKSIMHACGYRGEVEPLEVARLIASGDSRPLDLATISLSGPSDAVPNPFTSFLSVSWGLIGDVDISADFLRAQMGADRFQHSYTRRLRYPRLYHGALSYRPAGVAAADAPLPPLGQPLDLGSGWVTLEGPFLTLWACNVPWMTLESHVAPNAKFDDGMWQLAVGHGAALADMTPEELQAVVLEVQGAMNAHEEHPLFEVIETSAWRLEPTGRAEGASNESVEKIRSVGAKAMSRALGVSEEEGAEAMEAAGVSTEGDVDRVIELAATGKTLYSEQAGFISVDGEWAKYGDTQVDVHPGMGRVFFSPKGSSSPAAKL